MTNLNKKINITVTKTTVTIATSQTISCGAYSDSSMDYGGFAFGLK